MDSFKALLEGIEKRPEMYFGRRSMLSLKAFLDGWEYGREGNISDPEYLNGFSEWIHEQYKMTHYHTWCELLLYYYLDDEKAFDHFFIDLRRWKAETGRKTDQ